MTSSWRWIHCPMSNLKVFDPIHFSRQLLPTWFWNINQWGLTVVSSCHSIWNIDMANFAKYCHSPSQNFLICSSFYPCLLKVSLTLFSQTYSQVRTGSRLNCVSTSYLSYCRSHPPLFMGTPFPHQQHFVELSGQKEAGRFHSVNGKFSLEWIQF